MTNGSGDTSENAPATEAMVPNPHSWGNEIAGYEPEQEILGMDEFAKTIVGGLMAPRSNSLQNGETFMRMAGVFGPWGCGKTHVLNQLGPMLAKKGHRVCVFRAWEYEIEGDLASAFIRALSSEECYPWNLPTGAENEFIPDWNAVYDLGRDLGMLVLELAMAALPGKSGEIVSRVIDKLFKARNSEQNALPPKPVVTQIREQLDTLVSNVLPDDNPSCRLYVLIDDLDRCAPPNTVRILEWFKNHFANDRTTYVMFLDDNAAAHAIQGHYKDYASGKGDDLAFGYRYLEKIFEFNWRIPFGNKLVELGLHHSGIDNNSINQWFGGELSHHRFSAPLTEPMTDLFLNPLMQNPRSIIRGFNQFKAFGTSNNFSRNSANSIIEAANPNDIDDILRAWLILCLLDSTLNQDVFKTFRYYWLELESEIKPPRLAHDEQELFNSISVLKRDRDVLKRELNGTELLRNYEFIRRGA